MFMPVIYVTPPSKPVKGAVVGELGLSLTSRNFSQEVNPATNINANKYLIYLIVSLFKVYVKGYHNCSGCRISKSGKSEGGVGACIKRRTFRIVSGIFG